MPGFLLHFGATVRCLHGGDARPTVPSTKVFVGGQPIATLGAPYAVLGCTLPPPGAGNGPCVLGNWTTASLRVKSYGQAVVLFDSQSVCVPSGTPLRPILAQDKVSAT